MARDSLASKKFSGRRGRRAVLALVVMSIFSVIGVSVGASAFAGTNGQQVVFAAPQGLFVWDFQIPEDLRYYAKGTNQDGASTCVELDQFTAYGVPSYGKPGYWWKDGLEFYAVGNRDGAAVAYRADTHVNAFWLGHDVVHFPSVSTPWQAIAAADLKFEEIPGWQQDALPCQ